MKLAVKVELDSGGTLLINGEDLTAEDVNEVFGMLHKHTVVSQWQGPDKPWGPDHPDYDEMGQ